MSSGHLFVVRGDLRSIAADATLIPSDSQRNVTSAWWPLFADTDLGPATSAGWRRYLGQVGATWSNGAGRVGQTTWLFPAAHDSVEELVDAVRAALLVIADGLAEQDGRVRPLVTMPLAGTGEGGLAHERGAVVQQLVPALAAAAASLGVDLALVLWDDQDWAAVQAERQAAHFWAELVPAISDEADRLGQHAAGHDLALFLGAGVSRPLGLHDWHGLVSELCSTANVAGIGPDEDLQAAAERAVNALDGPGLSALLHTSFVVDRCTLAHALLAGLGLQRAVTTNYDTAYEVAVRGASPQGPDLKVLTDFSAAPDAPWLLKLHGDAVSGRDIVLTRSQYDALAERGQPLRGIVQTLLLTTHVLFVGYSMSDETYVRLAGEVRRVLEGTRERRERLGTVVPIVRDEALREANLDLTYVPMPVERGNEGEGARLLEVFLDRLAWRAAVSGTGAHRHLLDARYGDAVRSPGEDEVRRLAEALLAASPAARGTAAWSVLARALRELGSSAS